jgi:hypothetical protein
LRSKLGGDNLLRIRDEREVVDEGERRLERRRAAFAVGEDVDDEAKDVVRDLRGAREDSARVLDSSFGFRLLF